MIRKGISELQSPCASRAARGGWAVISSGAVGAFTACGLSKRVFIVRPKKQAATEVFPVRYVKTRQVAADSVEDARIAGSAFFRAAAILGRGPRFFTQGQGNGG
jgi:hypothetical protein